MESYLEQVLLREMQKRFSDKTESVLQEKWKQWDREKEDQCILCFIQFWKIKRHDII